MIDALAPAFAEGQKERDPLDYIEVLRDRAAINERFDELQAGIEREILVFTKPPYATPAAGERRRARGLEHAHRAQRLRVLGARRPRRSPPASAASSRPARRRAS